MERPRLQQLEALRVERPLDLDRHAENVFRLAQQAPERDRLSGIEAGRAHELFRHRLRHRALAVTASLAVILAAGFVLAQEALARQRDAVGHDLALRDRRAKSPGGAEQHLTFGGLAQAA